MLACKGDGSTKVFIEDSRVLVELEFDGVRDLGAIAKDSSTFSEGLPSSALEDEACASTEGTC